MGQLASDAGESVRAAADWLSAAACFLLVPDPERMREAIGRVRQLDRDGRLPPERLDLHAALAEREDELRTLDATVARVPDAADRLTPAE